MTQEKLTPGTATFLKALAALLAKRGNEEIDTLPQDEEILSMNIDGSPFKWIGDDLQQLDARPAGALVGDVIDAMGITAFICSGSGQLIDGHYARRGFAFGIGSDRHGASMTGFQVAEAVKGIIDVIPRPN